VSLDAHTDEIEYRTFKTGTARVSDWLHELENFSGQHRADFRVLLARQVLDTEERLKEMAEALEAHRNTIVRQAAELRTLRTPTT
jgi:hypothetical protein